jgi:hypothetical protein
MNMAKHNIKEAARLAGVNRTTLYAYMKEGRISWETLPNGNRVIDTAELSRVFGTLQSFNTNSMSKSASYKNKSRRCVSMYKRLRQTRLTSGSDSIRLSIEQNEPKRSAGKSRCCSRICGRSHQPRRNANDGGGSGKKERVRA